jgi:hypothetical protein
MLTHGLNFTLIRRMFLHFAAIAEGLGSGDIRRLD